MEWSIFQLICNLNWPDFIRFFSVAAILHVGTISMEFTSKSYKGPSNLNISYLNYVKLITRSPLFNGGLTYCPLSWLVK